MPFASKAGKLLYVDKGFDKLLNASSILVLDAEIHFSLYLEIERFEKIRLNESFSFRFFSISVFKVFNNSVVVIVVLEIS